MSTTRELIQLVTLSVDKGVCAAYPAVALSLDAGTLVVATTILDDCGRSRMEQIEEVKAGVQAAFNLPAEGWQWFTERDISLQATGIYGYYPLVRSKDGNSDDLPLP